MESLNADVTALHLAYNTATGLQLPMMAAYERSWFGAVRNGVTPEMLTDVIKHRQDRIKAGVRYIESLRIRNLVGDEDAIGNLIEEAHFVASKKRIKVMEPGRASVLRATGRSDQPPEQLPKAVSDVLINALKQAAS